jgi:hypothetical protein
VAWYQWADDRLVPDEITVTWPRNAAEAIAGITNPTEIIAENTDGQSAVIDDRTTQTIMGGPSSQAVGVPSPVERRGVRTPGSSSGGAAVVEEAAPGLNHLLRAVGVPAHVDTSYLDKWGTTETVPYCDDQSSSPHVDMPAPETDHPPYLQRTAGQALDVDQQRASNITAPVITRPAWVCCAHGLPDPVLERWYDLMLGLPVDEAGLMSAMALAHYAIHGYDKLAQIIAEVEQGHHGHVRNWSSWFAVAIENARRELNPEGAAKYGGKNGNPRSKSSPIEPRSRRPP